MGKVFRFGNDIDTDVILPGQYLNLSDNAELAKVCMSGYEKDFINKVKPGDIFVALNNFGCGSSREHAPRSIKAAGISCIIAYSFSRIFYRSAINIGLPALESREAVDGLREGDECKVNLAEGKIYNLTQNCEYSFRPFPPKLQEIIDAGGMVSYIQSKHFE